MHKQLLEYNYGYIQRLKEQLLQLTNKPTLLQWLKQNIAPVRTFKEVAAEHYELYSRLK